MIKESYDRNKEKDRQSKIGIADPLTSPESVPSNLSSVAVVGDRPHGSWIQESRSKPEENHHPKLYQQSSSDRILPKPVHNLKNTTLWRNDEDEEGEADYRIILEHWENRGKNAMQIPWFPQA